MNALDTNYLINALVTGSAEAAALIAWHRKGEVLVAPSVVWYEFLCGPVSAREVGLIHALLRGGVIAYGEREAAESPRLFQCHGTFAPFAGGCHDRRLCLGIGLWPGDG